MPYLVSDPTEELLELDAAVAVRVNLHQHVLHRARTHATDVQRAQHGDDVYALNVALALAVEHVEHV